MPIGVVFEECDELVAIAMSLPEGENLFSLFEVDFAEVGVNVEEVFQGGVPVGSRCCVGKDRRQHGWSGG